jgi:hypothetical protein
MEAFGKTECIVSKKGKIEMKKKYMPFNCDKDIAKLIKRDAEQKRSSASQIIREILLKHYEKELQKKMNQAT